VIAKWAKMVISSHFNHLRNRLFEKLKLGPYFAPPNTAFVRGSENMFDECCVWFLTSKS
jgi:hypothetical protein